MSQARRREYLAKMRARYLAAGTRAEKSVILDEVVEALGYHRKYAIALLRRVAQRRARWRSPQARQYANVLAATTLAWETLDFCCAERLHPVLVPTVESLMAHGELSVDAGQLGELARISRATLARQLLNMPSPKARRPGRPSPITLLASVIPFGRYDWDVSRPGGLEIDLVEHRGGSTFGSFACTLSAIDLTTRWSRRRAVLGSGQDGVFRALRLIIGEWPYPCWGLHAANGPRVLEMHVARFAKESGLTDTGHRPGAVQTPGVVRVAVGQERYSTSVHMSQLNEVYALLDPYANLFLPGRRVQPRNLVGEPTRLRYEIAETPLHRVGRLEALRRVSFQALASGRAAMNPLQTHRLLTVMLSRTPLRRPLRSDAPRRTTRRTGL